MFEKEIYIRRRKALREKCRNGILLFPGNTESPMNYRSNTYHFRQDSNFLYFFGADRPDLAGIMDLDKDRDIMYGNDHDMDDIIWMGERPAISEIAGMAGIENAKPLKALKEYLQDAIKKGRMIKILPPYSCQQQFFIAGILGIEMNDVKNCISEEMIKAIVSLREIKEDNEIRQIEQAVDVAYKMHTSMMKMSFPGTWEREIAGKMEGIALSNSGPVSFPIILSMDGQTLHNHYHGNLLTEGRIIIADAGCESPLHYASDITRSVPVGGKFTQMQKEIYEIVLDANLKTIEGIKPGIYYRDLHLRSARIIAEGLKNIGLMKGNMDEAVQKGAHALFFPHGLGHMLGLDVHDMESLGEDHIGYDESVTRSKQFGTAYLRLAKKLKPGFVLTVEPGIYFIPALIDLWKREKRFEEFIRYDKLESWVKFGGIRIEDDILVTNSSCRVLGKPIPKTVSEIESLMAL